MKQNLTVHTLDELPLAAQTLIRHIGNCRVVAIYGAMGSGKTTLIKALCKVLGVPDQVNSPTFTLVNEYKTVDGKAIYHFDFYRINKIEEAYDLGYDDYFYGGGLCLVEWPELIENLLPEDCIRITIHEEPDGVREMVCKGKIFVPSQGI